AMADSGRTSSLLEGSQRPPCTGPAADASSLRDHFFRLLLLWRPPRPSCASAYTRRAEPAMPTEIAPLAPIDIARLEEAHQARGVADAAGYAEPIGGGLMCFGGEGSWASQACNLGLDGPVSGEDLDRLCHFYTSRGVEPRVEL